MSPKFATILGITDQELEMQFKTHLETLTTGEHISTNELLIKISHWYNGYSWDGSNRVYNPTSLLNLFFDNKFSNYWFATGTPTFLVNMIKDRQIDISGINHKKVGDHLFDSFDIDNLEIYCLLFQTGYLTIANIEKKHGILQYELDFPNFEVKESLLNYLLAAFTGKETAEIQPIYLELLDCLEEKDIDRFLLILTSIFAKIPCNLHLKHESYYHSLCYMILTLMGTKIDLEILSDKGRVDGILTLEKQIYVIEFKMGTAREALQQIKERKYYQQFWGSDKEMLLLGIGGFAKKELEYCLEPAPPNAVKNKD